MNIYDDFYIQCCILCLLVIAALFLFDVIIDPFKLQDTDILAENHHTNKP